MFFKWLGTLLFSAFCCQIQKKNHSISLCKLPYQRYDYRRIQQIHANPYSKSDFDPWQPNQLMRYRLFWKNKNNNNNHKSQIILHFRAKLNRIKPNRWWTKKKNVIVLKEHFCFVLNFKLTATLWRIGNFTCWEKNWNIPKILLVVYIHRMNTV